MNKANLHGANRSYLISEDKLESALENGESGEITTGVKESIAPKLPLSAARLTASLEHELQLHYLRAL